MEKPPRGKGILIHLLLPFCCSKMLLAIIFLQISPQALAVSSESHWTYEGSHGQEHWPDTFPDCGWKAQSPVDIQMGSVQYDPSLPPIEPEGYWNPGSGDFTLINNGHTVQMSLPPSMRLHGLPSDFSAVQLHFHWGGKGHSKGSEHKVDGKSFPAELHVVHFNSEKYRNVSVAKHQPDGLAVLGIFLEQAGDVANPAYDHILDHLDKIQYAGNNHRPFQRAQPPPGTFGPLFPLQWLADDSALLPECAVDCLPPASPHLRCPAGDAAEICLLY
ncbi:carbonic anhydrase 14 isoform X7 [Rhineura floridana]|uniref:carbonic anhydrase 14 isoform X7 n=1 Tax=Rhineura floridana TaxID=261503 RepID=UPI002AC83453|nr:carbonic anhydrase 14 isoform X7 [Rhineura floridana]